MVCVNRASRSASAISAALRARTRALCAQFRLARLLPGRSRSRRSAAERRRRPRCRHRWSTPRDPLYKAIGYSCWRVARLLVARGAPVDKPWQAAALGLRERLEQLLDGCLDNSDAVSQAFWHACDGGQRRAAEYLLARGAELNWVPEYLDQVIVHTRVAQRRLSGSQPEQS